MLERSFDLETQQWELQCTEHPYIKDSLRSLPSSAPCKVPPALAHRLPALSLNHRASLSRYYTFWTPLGPSNNSRLRQTLAHLNKEEDDCEEVRQYYVRAVRQVSQTKAVYRSCEMEKGKTGHVMKMLTQNVHK